MAFVEVNKVEKIIGGVRGASPAPAIQELVFAFRNGKYAFDVSQFVTAIQLIVGRKGLCTEEECLPGRPIRIRSSVVGGEVWKIRVADGTHFYTDKAGKDAILAAV